MTEWVILQYLICEYLICYFIYYFICLFFEHRPANSQALEWDSLIISPSHSQALVKHCPNLQKILVFSTPFCPKTENFLAPPNRIFIAQSKQISAPNTKFFAPKLSLKQLLHPRVGRPVWTTDHDSCIWLIWRRIFLLYVCITFVRRGDFVELIWNWVWTDRGLPTLSLKHAWELVGLPVCLRLTHFPLPQAVQGKQVFPLLFAPNQKLYAPN